MEQTKVNIDVTKINKKTKQIEWTETIEIPYDTSEKISEEEKKKIEQIYSKKDEDINKDRDMNPLLNTTVLKMDSNPFHQPSMNTIEFEDQESFIVANISKENNEPINNEEELLALEKLLENGIINQKEFDEKKQIILEKNN